MGELCAEHVSSVAKSCPTLCDPRDCSPPGSPVHGVLQARILEWVAISSFRGFFKPRNQTGISYVSCTGMLPSSEAMASFRTQEGRPLGRLTLIVLQPHGSESISP